MKHDNPEKKHWNRLWLIPAIIAGVALGFLVTYQAIKLNGKIQFQNAALGKKPHMSQSATSTGGLPSERADVFYEGKGYNYKEGLTNLLVMGVDKKASGTGEHRADAIYLVSIDELEKKVNIVAVSRNTMAEMKVFGLDGTPMGVDQKQLCLAYTYGETDEEASERMVETVSDLFYGLPIQGYCTLFMDSVPIIADAVGGVTVTLEQDFTAISPEMKAGETVTLTGKKAYRYLHDRDTAVFESNEARLDRQKKFITSFLDAAISAIKQDPTLPVTMYQVLSEYSVTNVSLSNAVYLADVGLQSTLGEFAKVQGKTEMQGELEAYYIDENELYQLVLGLFYQQVEQIDN